jgi:tRNA (guanine37-N1)-methyltransferase
MWSVNILTLFPELFPGPLGYSITGQGLKKSIWEINAHNIRDYAHDKHKTVDEPPYGGGGGMVLKADVLGNAIDNVFLNNKYDIIYLSPRGKLFNQELAEYFIQKPGLNIICGRFEGIDERLINEYRILEVSIGDFVLSSGDIAAYSFLDCCIRLLPGVLGNDESLGEESFGRSLQYQGLLEYPHFTRPQCWKGVMVPEILVSGDHELIKAWRLDQAKLKTKVARADLWDRYLERNEK